MEIVSQQNVRFYAAGPIKNTCFSPTHKKKQFEDTPMPDLSKKVCRKKTASEYSEAASKYETLLITQPSAS